ncbi:isochorismatase family protein [Brachyspira aalborgi]|jgi:nicotinamidase/pyrazinamidase|uniref:nicotinamidase n=1 Tax=Brachyspira aalborgi TaxID=29522 RepID=A0A5C8E9R2_9SPIR|nr:isochorismatase family protein [Brachyspira aalborgi]MBS4762714.1 isochorismatase family protein [Brachyspira sp.]CCY75273.1 bifunctional pyrazinamidase/nicotinamidase [Brachyspira sp. CAG:700]TXJ13386.1 isochorismatase family protein [Brachyspira aalborgi]TXJ16949.1 isochorismatase family protein [Brachyspira aalborgi]TXJ19742.1 isochorismatase family protein [Brachyspira aalborgi]
MSKIKILTIVDMQNDYMKGGPMAVKGADELIPIINELIKNGEYDAIIATQDWHPSNHISFASTHDREPFSTIKVMDKETGEEEILTLLPRHCVARTYGSAIVDGLKRKKDYIYVQKGVDADDDGISGFSYMHKDFIDAARENKEVLILDFVGVALDNCVYHTSKDTADYVASINAEYLVNVNVLEYACASINYENAEKLYSASQNINIKKVKL